MKLFIVLSFIALTLCKEEGVKIKGKDKTKSESDKSDGYDVFTHQCCSKETDGCCISLTYESSSSEEEDVPVEFGGVYYCETIKVEKTSECGDLDYIVLPLSKSCDLTRAIWDLEGAEGFNKAQLLADNTIVLNNADEFLLSPDDEDNPTDFHALKFPLDCEDEECKAISICTQLEWGDIVDNIDNKEIEIGYNVDDDKFKCNNATIRDICSIDTSLAMYGAQSSSSSMNIINLHQHQQQHGHNGNGNKNTMEDPRFDSFYYTFEYYWDQWIGLGIAVFAASIFFNFVMCIYWSGLKGFDDDNVTTKKTKIFIDDGDDETEEESDDTDQSDADDPHI